MFQPNAFENVIPCKKCHANKMLPDAAILQFKSSGNITSTKNFRVGLKFAIKPSDDDNATVTEHDVSVRVDVSQVNTNQFKSLAGVAPDDQR